MTNTTNMTTLRIPLHSFVDLITNSSSEIFISATNSTIIAIKKLVDALLLAGGSRFTSDEVFEITLEDHPYYDKEDQNYFERDVGHRKQVVVIKTKINSQAAKDAAGILSNLTESFFIQERYGGNG